MASLRFSTRKDGTPYIQVLYRHRGKQTSQSFFDEEGAVQFRDRINQLGVDRALALLRAEQGSSTDMTVHEWLDYYIAHLTGVDEGTVIKYRAYVRNDIAPRLGTIPLGALSDTDIARWVQWMQEYGCLDRTGKRGPAKPKTIKNKHGFLSGALAGAVRAGHIVANPTVGRRLPQDEANEIDDETVFLSRAEFTILLKALSEYWRPLVEFLVASGCRWGEATALRPTDVNRTEGTVRIRRAWTYSSGSGHRLVKPKGKSRRTINVPAAVLDRLDYSREWLFTNSGRGHRGEDGPVRAPSFHAKVWQPAVERSGLSPKPRVHDLRHTCASWLIAAHVSPKVIQEHLGHQSFKTTMDIYGHLDRSTARLAADAIADALNHS